MLELLRGVQKRNGGKEKTIIFSQFTKFLDLLEPFLKAEGFGYVRCESFEARRLLTSRRWFSAQRPAREGSRGDQDV